MTNKILTKIMAGTMCLSLGGCRGNIHKVVNKTHYPIIERVDSFAKSSLNKVDTTGLELFKVDTIFINDKKLNSPIEFAKALKKKAIEKASIKKVLVDSHIGYGYGFKLTGGHGYGLVRKNKYKLYYLPESAKPILQNKVYATRHENNFYVPVSYYAKKNPEIQNK